MLNVLNYDGKLTVNGVEYNSSADALNALLNYAGDVTVEINVAKAPSASVTATDVPDEPAKDEQTYRLKVRQYMTRKGSPEFDFMEKFNANVPMPLRVMYGQILSETKGMYRMSLYAKAERSEITKTVSCMRCGRELKNPTSKLYGIGPECINYTLGTFSDDGDPDDVYERADNTLQTVRWTGWVIKSAIESMDKV
jgi:hypothetical protein